MRVNKITIKNILGISEVSITPGAFTEIEGINASGKTSVLEAIKTAFGGGHDGTLLKKGAESGETILVLDDDVTIKKQVTAGKSNLDVRHSTFGKVSAPKTYIDSIIDSLSVNPVRFLMASQKDRVAILLEALPMKITSDQLKEANVPTYIDIPDPVDNHALVVIDSAKSKLFAERTGINRSAKDKRSTAAEMEKTLPEMPEDGDWHETLATLQDEMLTLDAAALGTCQGIKERARHTEDKNKEDCRKSVDTINAKCEIAVKRLAGNAIVDCQIQFDKRDLKIEEIDKKRLERLEKADAEYKPQQKKLSEKCGHARAMVTAQVKAESTKEFIAAQFNDAKDHERASKVLTTIIKRLDNLKGELLKDLPIKGLEVKDGEIYLNGIAFDRVNEAERISMAMEIARIRSGKLGLVLCDGLECLDKKTFEAFRKRAVKTGLQFIVTRVTDEQLTIHDEK